MSRPEKWSDDEKSNIKDSICTDIACGHSLTKILDGDEALPSYKTIMLWLQDDSVFLQNYREAQEFRSEIHNDQLIDLADEKPGSYRDVNGEVHVDSGWVSYQKNRIDARKWHMSKMNPKKYGDKVNVEATGKDGAPLNPPTVHIFLPDNGRSTKDR